MTAIVLAIIGWLLFVATALLYWLGNRLNAKETNSLAIYSLAILLSDEFRKAVLAGFNRAIDEDRAQRGSTPQTIVFWLMQAVTQNAKSCYKPDADPNTMSIVVNAIGKKA